MPRKRELTRLAPVVVSGRFGWRQIGQAHRTTEAREMARWHFPRRRTRVTFTHATYLPHLECDGACFLVEVVKERADA